MGHPVDVHLGELDQNLPLATLSLIDTRGEVTHPMLKLDSQRGENVHSGELSADVEFKDQWQHQT